MNKKKTIKLSEFPVMYKSGDLNFQTSIYDNKCVYSGKSVAYFEKLGYKLFTLEKALELLNKELDSSCVKPFKEVSKDYYWEHYECLPPEAWVNINGINFFRMSEYQTSNITEHFICYKNRYFSALKRTTTTPKENLDEIIEQYF